VINLVPTAEQQQIIDSVAGYLTRQFPLERLRPHTAGKHPHECDKWMDLSAHGWFGLGIPEDMGGAGFSIVEEVLAYREFGRFLATPGVLATSLGAHLACAAGEAELVGALVSGEARVAAASPIGPATVGAVLDGALHLFDSRGSKFLIVWNEDGMALVERERLTDIRSVPGLDSTVTLERAYAEKARTRIFLPFADVALRHRANLLIAASLVGMAEAARDLAVAHACVREQFGKPIGAFQGVAHHCADMEVRARAARAQTFFAAVSARDMRSHAALQISAAAIVAADAALKNATMSIRVHGGMGYTAECDVHHYLKRAHLFGQLNGTSRTRQAELLAQPAPDLSAPAEDT